MNEEIKMLEENDLELMKDIIEDDKMVFDIKSLKRFINREQNYGFIVKVDDKIVGFAYAYELLRPDNKIMFYIHSIGILSNYQDKGLGSKLMSYILEYARSNGYMESWIITDKGNPRACHLYEKLGGENDCENEIVYVYNFEKSI